MLCALWTLVQRCLIFHSLVLLVLALPTCQTLHFGLLSGRVVGLGMCRRCVWLSGSWSCGWLLLGTKVLLGGICMLLHPIHLVSSTFGGFSALWAVFWAPPSDPTHISCVVVNARCYLFAALVAVLLWCGRVVHANRSPCVWAGWVLGFRQCGDAHSRSLCCWPVPAAPYPRISPVCHWCSVQPCSAKTVPCSDS